MYTKQHNKIHNNIYVYENVRIYIFMHIYGTIHMFTYNPYVVASINRLLKILGFFCKRALWKSRYSAKETKNFKEPTSRSHPISICVYVCMKESISIRTNHIYIYLYIYIYISIYLYMYIYAYSHRYLYLIIQIYVHKFMRCHYVYVYM